MVLAITQATVPYSRYWYSSVKPEGSLWQACAITSLEDKTHCTSYRLVSGQWVPKKGYRLCSSSLMSRVYSAMLSEKNGQSGLLNHASKLNQRQSYMHMYKTVQDWPNSLDKLTAKAYTGSATFCHCANMNVDLCKYLWPVLHCRYWHSGAIDVVELHATITWLLQLVYNSQAVQYVRDQLTF